jgi:hypothetical protein
MGIALAVLFLTLGLFQFTQAAADAISARATITREAYYTYPITQTTPPLLRNGFPPATACLVAGLVGVPQLCGTEAQQVGSLLGLSDGLPIPITPDSELAQPIVLPGTTPVGMAGGQPRYVSLAALNLPTLPAGERFGKFELVLAEDGVNYAIESPALRSAVLKAVGQIEDQDPQQVADAIGAILNGDVPLATQTITGIEACPITDPWNAGPGQSASLDGSRLPRTNCITGTTGVFDDKTRTWTFDLTFAVQAWTEAVDGNVLANQGIMLRPVGAPNLAYGDPDFSTNWTVSLANSANSNESLLPRVRYTTVADESAGGADLGGTGGLPDLGLGGTTGDVGFGSGGGDLGGGLGGLGGVLAGGGQASGSVGNPRTIASHSSTPAWLWFLLPLALIGSYMFDQSLSATPAALRRRPGALTHLELRREKD